MRFLLERIKYAPGKNFSAHFLSLIFVIIITSIISGEILRINTAEKVVQVIRNVVERLLLAENSRSLIVVKNNWNNH